MNSGKPCSVRLTEGLGVTLDEAANPLRVGRERDVRGRQIRPPKARATFEALSRFLPRCGHSLPSSLRRKVRLHFQSVAGATEALLVRTPRWLDGLEFLSIEQQFGSPSNTSIRFRGR